MISVCIPVFNRDITDLITRISGEVSSLSSDVEILVVDDRSTDAALEQNNARIVEAKKGRYIRLERNLGREKVRRHLAEIARFPFLIFLDNDVFPVEENFLLRYIQNLSPDTVLCGGPVYRNEIPPPELRLHWEYGKIREVAKEETAFFSCNFCISKEWMLKVPNFELPFPYGHEDTLMHLWLGSNGVTVRNLDNPVYHDQLKPYALFIEQQKQAVQNLFFIYTHTNWKKEIEKYSSLIRVYEKCRHWGVTTLLRRLYPNIKRTAEKRLSTSNPSLRWLDLYKLAYFCKISNK